MDKKIDLRSDTVTKPTAEMLEAMMSSKIGDDVFDEDPTVNELQDKLAKMFNMQAALFCPSGTMSNQIAIKCFTNPMDEVICDQTAHVYRYEGGGIAYNSMASVRLLHGERGILTPEMIAPEINAENIHYPSSTLVVLENTVNKGGGKCYHLDQIAPINNLCAAKGIKLHLDGARLFNALVATGDQAQDYGKYFDGISICLSKGLGAPVGSVFLSNKTTINKAKKIRKVLGGGMRQAGFLAAAGIYALDHHVARLVDDHQHAKVLASALQKANYVNKVVPVETNIVLFDVSANLTAAQVVAAFETKGVLCTATSNQTIRFVTHLDVTSAMVDQALEVIAHLSV